ncbi:MAG: TSUP family transporter [Saprospiraceae bacterium]
MYWIIGATAFLASLLTLFSGFGLGTILLPVMGLFFPVHVAVALTGVVHLLNNIFKLTLVGRHADQSMVWRFGIPSVLGGLLGAWLLSQLVHAPLWFVWHWGGAAFEVTYIKVVIGLLMMVFAFQELSPAGRRMQFGPQYLRLGGLISGFFGGLSGHQGALRSAFLINAGLDKSAFIATGVVIACLVDLTRLPVYFGRFLGAEAGTNWGVLLTATLCAFAGAFIGTRYMQKVTVEAVRWITGVLIVVIGVLLVLGVL